jgi:hypothetical protein
MTLRFTLCPDCEEKYKALRFDPAADSLLSIMPLCAPFWLDDHLDVDPGVGQYIPFFSRHLEGHEECRDAIIRLASARTRLWRAGELICPAGA